MGDIKQQIRTGLSALAIPADETQVARLGAFLAELDRWNRRFGFIRAEGAGLVAPHLLDALAGLALLSGLVPAGGAVLDFGSGAGFPGLPLAFFMRDRRFILCERKTKENAFLKNAVLMLGLDRVEVIDDIACVPERSVDAIVFRAVTSLAEIHGSARLCLKDDGFLFAYKGKREKIDAEIAEIERLGLEASVHRLVVPRVAAERHIVVVRRTHS